MMPACGGDGKAVPVDCEEGDAGCEESEYAEAEQRRPWGLRRRRGGAGRRTGSGGARERLEAGGRKAYRADAQAADATRAPAQVLGWVKVPEQAAWGHHAGEVVGRPVPAVGKEAPVATEAAAQVVRPACTVRCSSV